MTITFRILLIWVLVSAIAFAVQLNWMSATYTPEGYVPVGNDSFYHARRIIDTAGDPQRFYEFDERIHAPEGSLVVWPWGYDFGMSVLLRGGQLIGLADDPVRFLAYVPPFAVLITIALAIGIGRQLEFATPAIVVLALCIALSPLTQGMHAIGNIDHHFAEYVMILAAIWSGLRWLRYPGSRAEATLAGVILGCAPVVHNGLFLIQTVLLLTISLVWLRGANLSSRAGGYFAAALLCSTLLIVAPSQAFRQGAFEFYFLSWFHPYVAACTAGIVMMVTRVKPRKASMTILLLGAALMSVPILSDIVRAGDFVAKDAAILKDVVEARSVWTLYQTRGPVWLTRLYSGLILISPLIWIACVLALPKLRDRRLVLVCVHAALMLPLLWAQFRFQYYGSLALYLPLIALADRAVKRTGRRAITAGLGLILLMAYFPALTHGLGGGMPLGNEPYYPLTRLAMPALAQACREDPGIVLARNNDGHIIRFHTGCSVIANNFLLTKQHFDAVSHVDRLFHMSPQELLDSGEPIKYVFVRARGILVMKEDGDMALVPPKERAVVSDRLSDSLLWADSSAAPEGFDLISEVRVPGGAYPYARIWKIKAGLRLRMTGVTALGVGDVQSAHHQKNAELSSRKAWTQ